MWAGDELRAAEDAAKLAREAELVLTGPLERTGELPGLEAARAMMLLEDAMRIRETPQAAGLLAHARALDAFQKDRPERAREKVGKARSLLGDTPDLIVLSAALATQRGARDEASRLLEAALTKHPTHARLRIAAADHALDTDAPKRARQLLESLIAEHPRMASLHNRLGVALEADGQAELSLEAYLRAAELDPSLHQPLVNVGRIRLAAGDHRAAEDAFGEAIKRAASEPDAWLGRGLARRALGDSEGGALDIERARQLAPGEAAPLLAQADVDAQTGQLQRALERYQAVLVITPDDAVVWLKLGNAQVRSADLEAARSSFERAIQLQPKMAAAHNGLGATLAALGQQEEATAMLLRASELDRHDPNPLLNLARVRRTQGDLHGAKAAEQAALALR